MPSVRAERHGPVALLTLDRPERFNAFDPDLARDLHDHVRAAAQDPDVGCLVLTGAGKAFCAGGDVKAMERAHAEGDAPALFATLTQHFHPTIRTLVTMDKPAIAAVNGPAAGGGYGLALACDLRIASEAARFKPAYFTLGVVPDGGITWLLPRLVGAGRARELLLTDASVDAARALELGLVSRVVPAGDLMKEALAWAQRLAQAPRFAVGRTKALLDQGALASLGQQLRDERRWNRASAALPDFEEGLRAFQEKRPPRFGASP